MVHNLKREVREGERKGGREGGREGGRGSEIKCMGVWGI